MNEEEHLLTVNRKKCKLPPVTEHDRKSSWPSLNGPATDVTSLPCASKMRGSSGDSMKKKIRLNIYLFYWNNNFKLFFQLTNKCQIDSKISRRRIEVVNAAPINTAVSILYGSNFQFWVFWIFGDREKETLASDSGQCRMSRAL